MSTFPLNFSRRCTFSKATELVTSPKLKQRAIKPVDVVNNVIKHDYYLLITGTYITVNNLTVKMIISLHSLL